MLLSRKTCCPVFDGCPFKYTSFQEHRCSFVACWFFFVLFANVLVRCLYEESTLVIISLTILKSWLLIWWQCSLLNISSILLKHIYCKGQPWAGNRHNHFIMGYEQRKSYYHPNSSYSHNETKLRPFVSVRPGFVLQTIRMNEERERGNTRWFPLLTYKSQLSFPSRIKTP